MRRTWSVYVVLAVVSLLAAACMTASAAAAEAPSGKVPWWDQGKIRFFWGQWPHLTASDRGNQSPDALMSALVKVGATVFVHHAPAPAADQARLAATARAHGLRFFGVLYVKELVKFTGRLNAPLAVDALGNTSEKLPDPFFKPAYEEWFLKPAMEMAKSGVIDGLHVDWEFYGGNGEGRDVYNDLYFSTWLTNKGISVNVPVRERRDWLVSQGLLDDYLGYLRDRTRDMFAEFAAKVRKIKPDFIFSSYDGFFGDNLENGGWRVSGISAGLHSPNAPYFVLDPRHYYDYHEAPSWDGFYAYHHSRGYKHIGGSWDNRFLGGQPMIQIGLSQWMYEMSMNSDGYWLWFEHEFGEVDWQHMAAANRRIKSVEQVLGPFLLRGRQDNQFVTVVEWSGNPQLDRKVKQRAYHLGGEHLIRVANVDSCRPVKVRLRFPNLPAQSRWTLREPLSGLHYGYVTGTEVWDASQLDEGLVVTLDRRSDLFLLLAPAGPRANATRPSALVSETGMPVRDGFFTSPNAEALASDATGTTRLLFTRTYPLGNFGSQGGWVIGSGLASGDVAGKSAQRLRSGSGNFWSPRWSPDRRKVLFTQYARGAGHIFTMNADGTGVVDLSSVSVPVPPVRNRVFCDRLPVWSPDGSKVAFVSDRDGNWEIYSMNADGTGVRRLTDSPGADSAPCWSPDGRKMAFETDRGLDTGIYVMNADGSEQKPIIRRAGDDIEPAWSPDGGRLVATSLTSYQRGLVFAEVRTGRLTLPRQPYLQVESPRWSPDGQRVAAVFYNNQERDNAGIAIFDLLAKGDQVKTDGIIGPVGQVEELRCRPLVDVGGVRPHPGGGRKGFPTWYSFGTQAPAWTVKTFHGVSWSPDGRELAFSSDLDPTGTFQIYTVRANRTPDNKIGFYLYREGSIDNAVVYARNGTGEWKEVFRDDFERRELGRDWRIVDGEFSIEAGRMTGHGTILCTRDFPGNQRLEYEAMAPGGGPAGDLSAVLSATEDSPMGGVLFAFGSYDNTFSKIQIRGAERTRCSALIVPGKWHRILCERDGAEMRQVIDGVEIQRFTDAANAWDSSVETATGPVALPDSSSAWPQETVWGAR